MRLKGVDDTYPPQKKSFAMVKWMAENYVRLTNGNTINADARILSTVTALITDGISFENMHFEFVFIVT